MSTTYTRLVHTLIHRCDARRQGGALYFYLTVVTIVWTKFLNNEAEVSRVDLPSFSSRRDRLPKTRAMLPLAFVRPQHPPSPSSLQLT